MHSFSENELARFRRAKRDLTQFLSSCEESCDISFWPGFRRVSPTEIGSVVDTHWKESRYEVDKTITGNIYKHSDVQNPLLPFRIDFRRMSIEDGQKNLPYFLVRLGSSNNKAVDFSNYPQLLIRITEPRLSVEDLSKLYVLANGYRELHG